MVQETHYYPFGGILEGIGIDGDWEFLYQGKEIIAAFGYNNYDFHARQYDPFLGRFNSIDPKNQFASGYEGMGNNPISFADPDGEWVQYAIGAILGGFNGFQIGKSQGAKGWGMAGYIFGGAGIGALTGGIANNIANSGITFANTTAIAASSTFNSVGMSVISGFNSPVTTSFGAFSIDWSNRQVGFFGKRGNTALENVGFGLESLANIQDVLAGYKPGSVELRTENDINYMKEDINGTSNPQKDLIGHSQLTDGASTMVDFGPTETLEYLFKSVSGTNNYENGLLSPEFMKWAPLDVKGVNISRIQKFGNNLSFKLPKYNLCFNSCVSMTSRALNISGALNVGIHPYILHAQMGFRSLGFRPSLFSTFFSNN